MGKKRYPLGVLLAGNAGPHGGASKYTTNGSLFRSLFMCRRKLILRLTNVDHSPQYNIVVRSYDYGGVAVAQGTILIMLMHTFSVTVVAQAGTSGATATISICTFSTFCELEHKVIRNAWLLLLEEPVPLRDIVANYSKKNEISINK